MSEQEERPVYEPTTISGEDAEQLEPGQYTEKDGVFYSVEDLESPADSPEEGTTVKDKSTDDDTDKTPPTKEGDDTKSAGVEKETASPAPSGDTDTYEGKSREDIIRMNLNAARKISEQGKELSSLKKKADIAAMSTDEMRETLTAEEMKQAFLQQRKALRQIDSDIDPDEYDKQADLVDQLELEWEQKSRLELHNSEQTKSANEQMKEDQKKRFKESGVNLSNEEFDVVSQAAEQYQDNGRFTQNSFDHALIDMLGVDTYRTYFTAAGEQKAREEIKKAQGKKEVKLDVKGDGVKRRLVPVTDLTPEKIDVMGDDPYWTPERLEKLRKQVEASAG